MRKESLEFLKQLLTTPSPSGFESAIQKIWCDYARGFADEVITDSYGNAVAVLNGDGDPKVMIDGHADELGLMIKHIDDKGFIYFQRIGGFDTGVLRSKRVNIHTEKGIVRGVIGATAIHLQERDKEPKVPKMHELFIDIGAKDGKTAKARVSVGDPITFIDDFEMISKDLCIARGLDNRVGCWASIEALRIASAHKGSLKCALYATSSVQEEVGCFGAAMTAFNINPHVAIAIDVTHATDTPGIDVKQHGEVKLGGGPTVSLGRENHPVLVSRLRKIARTHKINLQIETFSTTGGTDAMAIFNKQGGIPSAIVGIPNRYMHTTVELVHLPDLLNVANLLAAFALDIKSGERFKVQI
ncbi:MAG: M42 family metallopeptidase [Planctomycetaceae bacterium]|nr:M42 family metallopeptidase [Planctomycetaceae bacterium]